MREEIKSQMTRPEEGERGSGVSHRRGGIGWDSYRRPPEDRRSEGLVKALDRVESPTSKAPGAKRKVESMRDKRAKRTASGKLHIDDGCMGGGEAITMTDDLKELKWDDEFLEVKWGKGWSEGSNWRNNEVNLGTNPYFTKGRWHIFHYCIFANENEGSSWDGVSEGPNHGFGDDFIIYDANMNPKVRDQAETFLHELGHNCGLYHPEDDPDVPDDAKTAMISVDKHPRYLDYHSEEWKKLDPSLISNGKYNGMKD